MAAPSGCNTSYKMAFYDDVNTPDLNQFIGQKWSDWQSAVNLQGESSSSVIKPRQHNNEVARLKRRDSALFGLCPAKDKFYVVVCELCHLPFKPQGFCFHVESHHKNKVPTKNDLHKAGLTNSHSQSISNEEKRRNKAAASVNKSADNSHAFHSKKDVPYFVNQDHQTSKHHLSMNSISNTRTKPTAVQTTISTAVSAKTNNQESLQKLQRQHMLTERNTEKHKPKALHKVVRKLSSETSLQQSAAKLIAYSHKTSPPLTNQAVVKEVTKFALFDEPLKIRRPSVGTVQSNKQDNWPILNSPTKLSPTSPTFRTLKHRHNPQSDIVKSADRGSFQRKLSAESEILHQSTKHQNTKLLKHASLKVRSFNPDKHCGVKTAGDESPCTGFLNCKIHPRSLKRKVLGRSKPFNELLSEQTVVKLKTKDNEVPTASYQQILTNSSKTETTSSNEFTSSHKSVNKISSVSKSSSISSTKKIQLFPRTISPAVVDLWHGSFSEKPFENVSGVHDFMPSHPIPLSICHFNSRKMSSNFICFNNKTNHQKYVIEKLNTRNTFDSSVSSSQRPPSRTGYSFSPLPSANNSLLQSLKNEKQEEEKKKTNSLDSTKRESKFFRLTSTNSSWNSAKPLSLTKLFANHQRLLSRSQSIRISSSSTKHARFHCDNQAGVDTVLGPPAAKSSRRSLSLDNKGRSNFAKVQQGHLILSNPTSCASNSSSSTLHNLQPQTNLRLAIRVDPKTSQVPSSSHKRIQNQNKVFNGKRFSNIKVNSSNPSVSTRHPPVNGFSSNFITSHNFHQSVTLSGGIGALQTSFISDDRQATSRQSTPANNCNVIVSTSQPSVDSLPADVDDFLAKTFDEFPSPISNTNLSDSSLTARQHTASSTTGHRRNQFSDLSEHCVTDLLSLFENDS